MTEASAPHILIYTTPTCPDCHVLKRWLSQRGMAYEERDLTDPRIAEESACWVTAQADAPESA